MEIFKKLIFFFTPKEKKDAIILLLMIILMAFIDMLSVASILPFITLLTNPGIIETNFFLKNLFEISFGFGIETQQEFIFLVGIMVFFYLIFSLTFKAITSYAQTRFCVMRGHTISQKLLETYLNQSYSWFLNQNSANLGKTILSETGMIKSWDNIFL